jgi:hypothetical protein
LYTLIKSESVPNAEDIRGTHSGVADISASVSHSGVDDIWGSQREVVDRSCSHIGIVDNQMASEWCCRYDIKVVLLISDITVVLISEDLTLVFLISEDLTVVLLISEDLTVKLLIS